jgi:hypothetical protein
MEVHLQLFLLLPLFLPLPLFLLLPLFLPLPLFLLLLLFLPLPLFVYAVILTLSLSKRKPPRFIFASAAALVVAVASEIERGLQPRV